MGVKELHSDVLWLAKKLPGHFLIQSELKLKTVLACMHKFSRAKYLARTSQLRKALIDWVKIITPLFLTNQSWNRKHSSLCMHMFSRAWRPLHILGSNSDGLWTDSLRSDWTTTKFALLKWCWLRTAGVSVLRAAKAASKMGIASPRSLSHSSLIAWAAAACLLATASSAFTT